MPISESINRGIYILIMAKVSKPIRLKSFGIGCIIIWRSWRYIRWKGEGFFIYRALTSCVTFVVFAYTLHLGEDGARGVTSKVEKDEKSVEPIFLFV